MVGAGAGARHEVTLEDVEQRRGEERAGLALYCGNRVGEDMTSIKVKTTTINIIIISSRQIYEQQHLFLLCFSQS